MSEPLLAHSFKDLAHALGAVGNAQPVAVDEVAVHRKQMAILHGAHARPFGPQFQSVLKQAGRHNRFGVSFNDGFHGHDRRFGFEVGEQRFAATQADDVGYQMLAVQGCERLAPYLIEQRHRHAVGVTRAQGVYPAAERHCRCMCLEAGAGEGAQSFDGARDVVESGGFVIERRDAQRKQPVELLLRIAAQPDDDEVRLECDDAFEVK